VGKNPPVVILGAPQNAFLAPIPKGPNYFGNTRLGPFITRPPVFRGKKKWKECGGKKIGKIPREKSNFLWTGKIILPNFLMKEENF